MANTREAAKRAALAGTAFALISLFATGPTWAQPTNDVTETDEAADTPIAQSDVEQSQDSGEIVVTGTSIRGVPPIGSNLIGVTRADIELIGAKSTPELLATVPQLNSFNTAPRAATLGTGAFAPGLRSLPASATLPLLNGHRLVAGSTQQTNPDFPFLPELALERVEIVADGASAIYGSDAVAGVVNFITRRNLDGVEVSARYGFADDYHTFDAGAAFGQDWGSGSLLAAYQYSENGNITGSDRRYRSLDFRAAGGVDTRGTVCPTANVDFFGLPGTTTYAFPNLTPGVNTCDLNGPVDLVPATRVHSGFVSARQDLSDAFTLWADVLYSDRKETVQAALPGQTVTILPTNPFFRPVPTVPLAFERVFFRPDNLFGTDHFDQTYRIKAINSSAGVDIRLPGNFNLSVYGTYDQARNRSFQPSINTTALSAAAAGTTAATALDPFGTGTSPAVVAAITDFANDVTIKQGTKLAAVKLDGQLATLPGGELKIAAGAEYRHEMFSQRGFVGASPVPEDHERNIKSVYGELFVPIFGPDNATTLMQRLTLSLSGRYDDYSDFGSTTNPKIGVNWDPVDGLTLRGTYGESFRAPGLRDLGATVGAVFASAALVDAFGVRDPSRGAAQVDTIYLIGGNRSLQPEKAKTYSFGADLRPRALPGFSASATYYNINYTDVVITPGGTIVFTDPTFASIVYRNPTQAQVTSLLAGTVPFFFPNPLPTVGNLIDRRQGNFGVRKTDGIDFDVSYRHDTGFGSVFGGIAGNYILNFDTQLSPTAPVSDSLQLGVPRTTLRTTLGAKAGPVTVVSFVNHRSGITSTFATPTGTGTYKANGYTTVDLRASVRLPEVGLANGTELSLQINDLFDETPPFFPGSDGIGGNYNPIGRYAAIGLRKAF